jgi:hypothetical protein
VVETGVTRQPPRTTVVVKRQEDCPVDPNNFGGSVGCIVNVPEPTDVPVPVVADNGCPPPDPNAVGGIIGCIPTSQLLPLPGEPVLIPLTGTAVGPDGSLPTLTITWTVSLLPLSTTVNGIAVPTTVPVWVCTGPSCNPDCSVPAIGCTNQETPGVNGFPWPQVSKS